MPDPENLTNDELASTIEPDAFWSHKSEYLNEAAKRLRDQKIIERVTPNVSLRNQFAGQALTGLLASGSQDGGPRGVAYDAFQYANAMMELVDD